MSSFLSDQESQALNRDGFIALEEVVDSKQIQAMRERLESILEATEQRHAGTRIASGLLDDPLFDPVWNHPRVLAAVEVVLGTPFRLVGVGSRSIRPGHGQQALHTDWSNHGIPGVWYMCHAICPLVDFTRQNGATRVLPGSHQNPWMIKGQKDLKKSHPAERQLVGKVGTVFILNVHCLHSAVHNSSREDRPAIFSGFSRRDSPLLLQAPIPGPAPATLARFPPNIQELLRDDG